MAQDLLMQEACQTDNGTQGRQDTRGTEGGAAIRCQGNKGIYATKDILQHCVKWLILHKTIMLTCAIVCHRLLVMAGDSASQGIEGNTMSKHNAIMAALNAIVDAVKESGKQGLPSDHLYALVMAHMSLDTYQQVIAALVKAGKIDQRGQVLFAANI
jgi:hypothetical protein